MDAVAEAMPRPVVAGGPLHWARRNLFSNWFNAILTIGALIVFARLGALIVRWLLNANWTPIVASPILYLAGQYPPAELWRPAAAILLVAFMFGLSWGKWGDLLRTFALLMLIGFTVVAVLPVGLGVLSIRFRLVLLAGDGLLLLGYALGRRGVVSSRNLVFLWLLSFAAIYFLLRGSTRVAQLPIVETTAWGGLMLNLLLAGVGILASFPLGIALALGRRSKLPVVRIFSILFIEIVRGVPLVTILFMASLMLPLFLPQDVRIDRVIRALIGITLFSAAYMAENVRGGLQAIPQGQYEAAKAIGLNNTLTTGLIILPQALRLVIPAIVGQFIALFKDTTLVYIVGLLELLGIAKSIVLGNPEFVGAHAEVLIFVAFIFWAFTFSLSHSSRRLERALGVGIR
jgi:general L-amino acid transport system permease protein